MKSDIVLNFNMCNLKKFFFLFIFLNSCVNKTNYSLDPTTPLGFNLQYNLCGILKICIPKVDQAPIPGDSGKLNFTNISKTSITLNWTLAIDDNTPQTAIQYLVYYSTKNNITALADIKANGIPFDSFVENINTKTISGLSPRTSYYFNLVALDSFGNQAVYVNNNAYTQNDIIVLFRNTFSTSGNMSGRNGADSLCSTSKENFFIAPNNITCAGIRAFVSFSGDNIVDMAKKYGFNSTNPIVSGSNILIANNWNELTTNNSIINSISTSQVSISSYWTFTTNTGGIFDPANSCLNGTNDTDTYNGIIGDATATNVAWISRIPQSCNTLRSILCVCY